MTVATGLDRIVRDPAALRGLRIGLIANPTSIDRELRHAADLFAAIDGVELGALFGPEHGIRGAAQDMISVGEDIDSATGVQVHSLYGTTEDTLSPTPASLHGLDAVVFDVQDVGARYYTYVWTMVLAMRACAGAGVRFVVLDRPNPLGGAVEGGGIAEGFHSFVGLCSVPNRHGLTAGELAKLICAREALDLELEVVAMEGWSRAMYYDQTGLRWVQPSPNMPTLETAVVYPGQCLLEGTDLSEGRGTTRPFELFGAPFVEPRQLILALEDLALPGVRFRPVHILPMFQKHAGVLCGGAQMHVDDRVAFRPYLSSVAILSVLRELYGDRLVWRSQAYEFVSDVPAIDLLAGSAALRDGIESGASLAELSAPWAEYEADFRRECEGHFLYQ